MVEYKGYIAAQQPELTENQLAVAPPLLGQPVRHAFYSFHNSTNGAPHPFPSAKLGKTPITSGSLAFGLYGYTKRKEPALIKKENKIFLIYKEIQRDRKLFLIYDFALDTI
jgi:hypothetical protein